MISTVNIIPRRLLFPHSKILVHSCISATTTYANIAKNDDSISTFSIAVANPAVKCAQDNTTMNQLSETNQFMQSNLNTTMQESQSIKHQMIYSNGHASQLRNNNGPNQQFLWHPPCLHRFKNHQQLSL